MGILEVSFSRACTMVRRTYTQNGRTSHTAIWYLPYLETTYFWIIARDGALRESICQELPGDAVSAVRLRGVSPIRD